jgi:CheY-like chemotaxis protein
MSGVNSETAVPFQTPPAPILLVEDNPVNRQVAFGQLENLGLSVVWVENGREAIQLFNEHLFDVVIMDCQMPVLDGYETARLLRLRKAPPFSDGRRRPYIIALTAHALDGDREKCIEAGMDDFLSKPVTIDALRGALRRAGVSFSHMDSEDSNPSQERSLEGLLDAFQLADVLGCTTPDAIPEFEGMVPDFVEDVEKRMTQLESLHFPQDEALIHRLAHQLKGSAATFGFMRFSLLMSNLEVESNRMSDNRFQEWIDQARACWIKSLLHLQTEYPHLAR